MRKRKSNIFKGVDWVLIVMYLLFVFLGWLTIYEATFSETEFEIFDFSTKYGKQMIWILLSFIIIIVILAIDKKFYEQFSGIFYLASILTLAGLFVFGNNINGATSWYSFGSFAIQPSEFAKAATAAITKIPILIRGKRYFRAMFYESGTKTNPATVLNASDDQYPNAVGCISALH